MPMNRKIALLLLTFLASSALVSAQTREDAAFDKLRSLAGDWTGTFTWSGAHTASGKMDAQYYLTGGGSAVVENLTMDGTPVMTSVYHRDGAELRMTHFCAARNQPRLKATTFRPDDSGITFSFVDVTNLASPEAGHVHGLEIQFLASDHITLKFHFVAGSKESDELVDLTRKK
jgi:hypothetical protein